MTNSTPHVSGKAKVAVSPYEHIALGIPTWGEMDWGLLTVRSTAEGSGTSQGALHDTMRGSLESMDPSLGMAEGKAKLPCSSPAVVTPSLKSSLPSF